MSSTDYQFFTTRDTPVETRRELNVGDIWANQVRCKKCNEVVRSRNMHDFRFCPCGFVAVDGGSWYLRRVWKEGPAEEAFEELSEQYELLT